MTHTYFTTERVTVATRQRQANMLLLISELRKQELDSYQIAALLNVGPSGARKYIRTALDAHAIKVARMPSKADHHSTVYCIDNVALADELLGGQTDLAYKPRAKSKVHKQRLEEAKKQGRLVHKGDGDYLRLPPARPAARDLWTELFFGPAKAVA